MYAHILVPVDLAHSETLNDALRAAATLAEESTTITLAGVTTGQPGALAHDPAEYAEKLSIYAKEKGAELGVTFKPLALVSHDPSADLNKTLVHAVEEHNADCVVMASHKPGLAEHVFSSHAGYMANHAKVSVFVVR